MASATPPQAPDRNEARYLVIEEYSVASSLLHELGYQIEAYHPRQVGTSGLKEITRRIHHRSFGGVWICLPTAAHSIPPNKRGSILKELSCWFRLAHQEHLPAYIVGLRGRMWQDQSLADLVQDAVACEGRFALCHFNIRAGGTGTSPSALWFHAFATHPVDNARCKCKPNVEHVFDLDNGQGRGARVHALQRAMFPHLVRMLRIPPVGSLGEGACSTDPDCNINYTNDETSDNFPVAAESAAQAYPTEQAQRAKALKKAGHVAKPRAKFVEDHHDDLGDDLSGLGEQVAELLADTVVEHPPANDSCAAVRAMAVKGLPATNAEFRNWQPPTAWISSGMCRMCNNTAASSCWCCLTTTLPSACGL